MIANHGQSKKYHHDRVGCNSRLDSIQAAVLRVKLKQLEDYNEKRHHLANEYDGFLSAFSQIKVPQRASYSNHVFHQYTLQIAPEWRDKLHVYLQDFDIPSMIYYPIPAHRQQMFASFGSEQTQLPITDFLTERVISLPMHTEMQADQLDFILSKVGDFLNELK